MAPPVTLVSTRMDGEVEAAERYLSQGMALVKESLTVEPFVAVLGYSAQAHLQQARGNNHEAGQTLQGLARLAEQRHFPLHLWPR